MVHVRPEHLGVGESQLGEHSSTAPVGTRAAGGVGQRQAGRIPLSWLWAWHCLLLVIVNDFKNIREGWETSHSPKAFKGKVGRRHQPMRNEREEGFTLVVGVVLVDHGRIF